MNSRGFGLIGVLAVVAIVGIGSAFLIGGSSETEVTENTSSSPVPITNAISEAEAVADVMEDKAKMADDMMEDGMTSKNMPIEAPTPVERVSAPAATSDEVVATPGIYTAYSESALRNASGERILFFYAPWCPGCRGLESDINASLSDIPSGISIFKVDFDTATELRKKHGITTQHTVVALNPDGSTKKVVTGPQSLEAALASLE